MKLKHVATSTAGGTPDTGNSGFWSDDDAGGTPWVSIGDMSGRDLVSVTQKRLTAAGLLDRRLRPAPAGTVLFAMYASVGEVSTLAIPAVWNQALLGLTPHPEMADSRFLAYWLRHFAPQAVARANSATQANLGADQVMNFPFPDLNVDEQRRIAGFLDDRVARIDKIITARQQQASTMEEAFRSIEYQLTTVGNGATRESGIEWMPRIAEVSNLWRISRAFATGSGTTPRSDALEYYGEGTPWATTSDLRDNVITTLPRSVTAQAFRDYSALRTFPPGTLLIAMYGATVGRLGILDCDAATNQACCALLPLGPIETQYAFHWLHAQRTHIMTLASGGGQPNISQEVVRSLVIPAPKLSVQRELVQALSRHQTYATSVQTDLSRQITLLQEYKQSLITAAVSGEFDVTTASTKIPE